MSVARVLQPGLWHWEALHPEWSKTVSSYAVDTGAWLVLIDPLALPDDLAELAAARETAIVLTCPWHERDAESLSARLAAPVYAPPPEPFNDDAAWLRPDLEPLEAEGKIFRAGDRLPVGVEAFAGKKPCDLVLWIESHRALAVGDTLLDRGQGLEIPADWLSEGVTHAQMQDVLRPLLDLPVEIVLPTHGPPTDRAALERALT